MRNWYLGILLYKKVGEKYSRVLTGDAKNEMLGLPSGPPYMHLSVNQNHLLSRPTTISLALKAYPRIFFATVMTVL